MSATQEDEQLPTLIDGLHEDITQLRAVNERMLRTLDEMERLVAESIERIKALLESNP